jgi:hypothetical protein
MASQETLENRELAFVSMSGLETFTDPEGDLWVTGVCHFNLKSPDGLDDGPATNCTIGAKIEIDTSVQAASRLVLLRAHELLRRMASFSTDDLVTALERPAKVKPLFPPEEKI